MFRSPGTIVKQFMSEMAQVEKEDAEFGLSPATSSRCSLETDSVVWTSAVSSVKQCGRLSDQLGDLLVLMAWASPAGEGRMTEQRILKSGGASTGDQ